MKRLIKTLNNVYLIYDISECDYIIFDMLCSYSIIMPSFWFEN